MLTSTGICRTVSLKIMSQAVAKNKGTRPSAKDYRFDARLTEDQKTLIQRAADLEGRTMTDFVLRSAEAAAERTLEDRAILVLTARETAAFVDAALRSPEPNSALRDAALRYKRLVEP